MNRLAILRHAMCRLPTLLALLLCASMTSVPQATANDTGDAFVDFSVGEVEGEVELRTDVVNGVERITLTLDDVSLEDTVRMFAQTTGANIIATSAILDRKRVTVNLTDVDWRPALRSILEIHKLALVERTPGSGIYSIREQVPDAPPPTLVQTFFLDYTTTSEVRDAITGMLDPGATMTLFPSRNALVVRSSESNLGEVGALINELDLPGRQVLIETRILELTDDARKAVGIDWSVLEGYRVGLTDMSRIFENRQQRVITQRDRGLDYDLQGTFGQQLEFYDEDGQAIPGVIIDYDSWSAFPDVDGAFDSRRWEGTPWTTSDRARGRGMADQQQRERQAIRDYTDISTAILSPADFSLILSALQRTDGVSIVSNPKMIVSSGATNAFFSVGEREPIIETTIERGTQESPGDRETARLATQINTEFIRQGYLETGIDLRVVATVKTDDFIEADIRPSLRRTIGSKTVANNSWPIISVKEIDTTFTLRSGQTVAIGGLTGLEEGKRTVAVPILSSIPILGRLFRHEQDIQNQTETIIFVTLSVADPGTLANDAGIPIDSRLVHTRMLREETQREQFRQQLIAERTREETETIIVPEEGMDGREPEIVEPSEADDADNSNTNHSSPMSIRLREPMPIPPPTEATPRGDAPRNPRDGSQPVPRS